MKISPYRNGGISMRKELLIAMTSSAILLLTGCGATVTEQPAPQQSETVTANVRQTQPETTAPITEAPTSRPSTTRAVSTTRQTTVRLTTAAPTTVLLTTALNTTAKPATTTKATIYTTTQAITTTKATTTATTVASLPTSDIRVVQSSSPNPRFAESYFTVKSLPNVTPDASAISSAFRFALSVA